MAVYIHHLETLVPPHAYTQEYAKDLMSGWVGERRAQRLVRQVYRRSGIQTRYSVLRDFTPGVKPELFGTQPDGSLREPSTEERNRYYIASSRSLCVEVASRALSSVPGLDRSDITHVVTVSCTGFYNPGPDFDVVRGLALPESIERYHLGFMGCYAALPALRMARQFCVANPSAVVLIVCLELCSLHMQLGTTLDTILANALFADGAAAAVVSAREPAGNTPVLEVNHFASSLAPEGNEHMAWEIGNNGFNLILSSYIPEIIAGRMDSVVSGILSRADLAIEDVDVWAVHPGGKAILDKVETGLELSLPQLEASRDILRRYGNMSSTTILFVLEQILMSGRDVASSRICAMAFGPGLTIETAMLRRVPAQAKLRRAQAARDDRT